MRAHNRLQTAIRTTLLAVALMLTDAQADWPEFRGPTGDGHASHQAVGLPLDWSATRNVTWRTEIPHHGWSTPVVLGNQVWLTTATLDGGDFFVLCLDAATGKVLFNQRLFHCDNPEPLGNNVNTYASPSPAIEPGRVYLHFGTYGTACLDTKTFQTLWKRTDVNCRHFRGPASSVVLFESTLILTMDGADVQYLIALDKRTGETVWKTNRSVKFNDAEGFQGFAAEGDLRKAHSTPLIVNIDGTPQMFSPGAKAAYAYDPRSGRELWQVHYIAWSAAPRPLYSQGVALMITGLGATELWAIRIGGQGDVTDTRVAWKVKNAAQTASPIIVDNLLYMVSDSGLATCVEVATGKLVWRERLGGTYAASPIYVDSRLYFCNQQGKTIVLKPGRTREVLATNKLDEGCLASPAVDGKALFLRTKTHLYRIESAKP
ncbi:MAG: PQQ-binding-like beta-propeller repeat protein [Tepidisphaeraceae bacterium]